MRDDSIIQDNKSDKNGRRQGIESWLNDHGYPNFNYLRSLAKNGSAESLDQLRSIADDLDVDYHSSMSPYDLVDKIMYVSSQNEDDENFHITR